MQPGVLAGICEQTHLGVKPLHITRILFFGGVTHSVTGPFDQ